MDTTRNRKRGIQVDAMEEKFLEKFLERKQDTLF